MNTINYDKFVGRIRDEIKSKLQNNLEEFKNKNKQDDDIDKILNLCVSKGIRELILINNDDDFSNLARASYVFLDREFSDDDSMYPVLTNDSKKEQIKSIFKNINKHIVDIDIQYYPLHSLNIAITYIVKKIPDYEIELFNKITQALKDTMVMSNFNLSMQDANLVTVKENFTDLDKSYLSLVVPSKNYNSLQAQILKNILNTINNLVVFYGFKLERDNDPNLDQEYIYYNVVLAEDKQISANNILKEVFDSSAEENRKSIHEILDAAEIKEYFKILIGEKDTTGLDKEYRISILDKEFLKMSLTSSFTPNGNALFISKVSDSPEVYRLIIGDNLAFISENKYYLIAMFMLAQKYDNANHKHKGIYNLFKEILETYDIRKN